MFFNWRKQHNKNRFYRQTRGILNTAPMPVVDAPFAIISMIDNTDVQMYLLALKSFYSRIGRGKIVAIVDRDMPREAIATLERHIPGIRFLILEDLKTGKCQRGGTWERLVCLLDHAETEYAIQLDADTLTFGDMSEIVDCIENNRAFTMVGAPRAIKNLVEAAADARAVQGNYIGLVTERVFDRYPNPLSTYYVRGSSGFAGFAKVAFPRERIEEFHFNMEKLLGERWTEWGTEQCGSNFAVANSAGALVLPNPKYAVYTAEDSDAHTSFYHFIGTNRYLKNYFAEKSIEFIRSLPTA